VSLTALLRGVLAGAVSLAAVVVITLTSPAVATAANSGCGSSSTPVAVHYVAVAVAAGSDHQGHISAVDLSGFDAGCDGSSVVFKMWGNPAGDPSVPLSGDSLLATADSTLDPCTQQPLTAPLTVQGGTVDLSLCPTGGPAADVSIHDLTQVELTVNGASVPSINSGSLVSPKLTTAQTGGGRGLLAFTGADLDRLLVAGAILLLSGLALAVRGRRQAVPVQSDGDPVGGES
jgi:hypothetical protein